LCGHTNTLEGTFGYLKIFNPFLYFRDLHLPLPMSGSRLLYLLLVSVCVCSCSIRKNADGEENQIMVNETDQLTDSLPRFSDNVPQLYNSFLLEVPAIEVTTQVGTLPRLPREVPGIYQEGVEGPPVRVLWPTPTDNKDVMNTGSYTLTGTVAGSSIQPIARITVKDDTPSAYPSQTLGTFHLSQVRLNPDKKGRSTKFQNHHDKFVQTLAKTDPDAFLYMFRDAFGQPQPKSVTPLGVWDAQEIKLRGHATGHYLSGIAQAYASTGYDPDLQANFGEKMNYLVEVLYELSQLSGTPETPGGVAVEDPTEVPPGPEKTNYASDLRTDSIRTDYWNWGKGYISAYPPDQFIMLEQGAVYGRETEHIWAPYYTLHKILAGLMDVYEISGNEKALKIAQGMGDWVHSRLSQLSTETLVSMWNRYIAGEYGGMNEAMARLSRLTEEEKYLETARLFDNIRVFYGGADRTHGLAKNVDLFRGLHANQHIPQMMGALEVYRTSGKPVYYDIASNFWHKAINDYSYSIGGVAGAHDPKNPECFPAQPASLYKNGLSMHGQNETCATYNLLKLTRNLFLFNQQPQLMDYYERGLYNHILASVAEHSPANTYHVPLFPGAAKEFSNAEMTGFTCCNGTALESATKLQNSIYLRSLDQKALYINLFIPSTLSWSKKQIKVTQKTDFPYDDEVQILINGKGQFDLNIRIPEWATQGVIANINGESVNTSNEQSGTYLTLSSNWNDGDIITLQIPFSFHLEPLMDQQNVASLFYGPILLACQEDGPRTDWRKIKLDAKDIGRTISGKPDQLTFHIGEALFKPFYETYGHHSVYLDVELQ
jgi:DUF1680 family protein